jgi:type IV secretory pathway TraG/TraD family ATPase VirD4
MVGSELQLRMFVDVTVAALGLVAVLIGRNADVLRLLCAPLLAMPLAATGAGVWQLVLTALPRFAAGIDHGGAALGGTCLCFTLGVFGGLWTPGRSARLRVVRGTRLVDGGARPWGPRPRRALLLAGERVPPSDETKHFKLIGTTGTGKTTAIQALLRCALERGDGAVIADPDGAYRRVFADWRRGDVSLNPLDPDACRWDLYAELEASADADTLARALIPDGAGDDRAWRTYARVFVGSLLRQLAYAGERDVGMLHRLVASAPVEELRELLDGTAASAYVSPDNARFFASVRAIASVDLAVLEPLAAHRAARVLSVRSWVRQLQRGEGVGVLFLPYRAGQLATLRGLVGAWLRLAIFEAMEGGGDAAALWFVIDELDALGPIDGLKDALTRLRKYGGRCVLGMQSIAQLSGTYGAPAAQTIVENCGNTLLLRCSAGEHGGTSRFASTLIGEREVLRVQTSRTRPVAFGRSERSRSDTVQHHVERAVLPAELEQLPDLHGYLRFASDGAWRRVRVRR